MVKKGATNLLICQIVAMASTPTNFRRPRFTESGRLTMDKQRRVILPKPWRLSTDKIAKVAKEGEGSKVDDERPMDSDELTYFFLMPWVLNGKKVRKRKMLKLVNGEW